MLDFRLEALKQFKRKPLPRWGPDLRRLDFGAFRYFTPAGVEKSDRWDSLPARLRTTYDRLGVPEAERRFGTGLQAQFDSEAVYGNIRRDLNRKGVIFTDTDSALRDHGDLLRRFFGSVVPARDNKFAALNSSVWSGGTFVYVPAGVHVDVPLHGYFHVNAQRMGQFEHTLVVLEENARLHYVEACSAPMYPTTSLHAGVVEVLVGPHARCRFTSIQNWAKDIYNMATKRAVTQPGAMMQWIGGNIGAKVTMGYPSVRLVGAGSRAEVLSLSLASAGQEQDSGARIIHEAPDTTSQVISKSISRCGGRSTFRGLVKVVRGACGARARVVCDSLILDPLSSCATFPEIDVSERNVEVGHEASVSKLETEQLFYLMSRGLNQHQASEMIVSGFVEPLAKELPLCYARQLNDLIRLRTDAAVG
jgi:Fe-S cluster assembly protein SufB